MDRAREGNETRQLVLDLGFIPVVPSMRTRIEAREDDREMYKRRNEIERLLRRLKGHRRIFSRFEKLDVMFIGFISFALIADGLRLCWYALVALATLGCTRCAVVGQVAGRR
jgi:transposase